MTELLIDSCAVCRYVFLAAGSSLKGQSDLKKFEKARALKVSSFFFRLTKKIPRLTGDHLPPLD